MLFWLLYQNRGAEITQMAVDLMYLIPISSTNQISAIHLCDGVDVFGHRHAQKGQA